MCRGGTGASARTTTTYYQLHISATTTTNYLLPEQVGAAEQSGACEGCPRHARGRRGRRSLHSQVPPAMGAWHELAGAEAIPQRRKSQSSWGASEREKGASPVGYRSVSSRTDYYLVVLRWWSRALLLQPARSGCCRTKWRLRGVSTPCQRAAWAEKPALPGFSSYGCLARTCWGRSYSAATHKPVLLGRVGKGEGRFSRWLPFGLEPNGFREVF